MTGRRTNMRKDGQGGGEKNVDKERGTVRRGEGQS